MNAARAGPGSVTLTLLERAAGLWGAGAPGWISPSVQPTATAWARQVTGGSPAMPVARAPWRCRRPAGGQPDRAARSLGAWRRRFPLWQLDKGQWSASSAGLKRGRNSGCATPSPITSIGRRSTTISAPAGRITPIPTPWIARWQGPDSMMAALLFSAWRQVRSWVSSRRTTATSWVTGEILTRWHHWGGRGAMHLAIEVGGGRRHALPAAHRCPALAGR